jgi:cell wall-associated NlpC family hydrolase
METQGVVTGNVVNLYSKPLPDVDLVTQAILGMGFAVVDSRSGWYRVRLPDQYRGWLEAGSVQIYAPGQRLYASAGPVAQIESLLAFLYHGPSVTARMPAMQVTLGARLEVTREHDGWLEVALPDGTVCWVQAGDVSVYPAPPPPVRGTAQDVIALARRFLGLPYLWGGCTPLGIDCSGFVQLLYGLNGVQLLRDADIQYTQPGLQPVGREDLEAGDLLFFGQERITHVGLYMSAGEFIHATTHGCPVVQISRLEEAHWTDRYQGARRP